MSKLISFVLVLGSVSYAGPLFNSDKIGVQYEVKYSQEPRYERWGSGIGMALNLGLFSFIYDIAHHPDVSKAQSSHNKFVGYGKGITSRISFKGFSKDLRQIWLNANYKNKNFELASGRDEMNVLVKAQIEKCNDEEIPQVIKRSSSLKSIIEGFNEFDFSHILHCSLKITKITTNAKHKSFLQTHNNYGFQDHIVVNSSSSITIDGDSPTITVSSRTRNPSPRVFEGNKTGPNYLTISYSLVSESVDKDKAAKGVAAGRKLGRKLMDYADYMVALYDEDEAKKAASVQAFFNEGAVKKFKDWIKTVKEGIPHMDI